MLACALGALVLFLTLFVPRAQKGAEVREVPRPTTENRGPNGYRGVLEWLDGQSVRVVSLRERFEELVRQPGLATRGNILIVTLPASAPVRTEELRPLQNWIRAGNTLLVLAALADTPDWAWLPGSSSANDLSVLTGLEFETARSRNLRLRGMQRAEVQGAEDRQRVVRAALAREYIRPHAITLVANRPHAYFAGVSEVVALSDYPSQSWAVRVPYDGFVLSLAHARETGEEVLWTRTLGEGRVVVCGLGSVFTNRALGLADNGRLLANIIGANLGPSASVLFDDAHQGLVAGYDPAHFYADRRLHLTIGVLVLVWLCWVLGGTRLRMPSRQLDGVNEADLVRTTGGFLARVLTPAAAARRMLEHFPGRLSASGLSASGLSGASVSGARVSQASVSRGGVDGAGLSGLERHASLASADLRQLRSWQQQAQRGESVPLDRLQALLNRLRRQLES